MIDPAKGAPVMAKLKRQLSPHKEELRYQNTRLAQARAQKHVERLAGVQPAAGDGGDGDAGGRCGKPARVSPALLWPLAHLRHCGLLPFGGDGPLCRIVWGHLSRCSGNCWWA